MSRSTRKTPIFPIADPKHGAGWWQRLCHKRNRLHSRLAIQNEEELPSLKWFLDPWLSPTDGKRWWSKATKRDMRK